MSTKIVVVLKVRPLLDREKHEKHWSVPNDKQINQIDVSTQSVKETHFFDHVFNETNTNQDVFGKVVQPIVDSVVNGINGTVFAYGQTSSGKTHTMVGDTEDVGVTRQAVEHIFQTMKNQQGREFLLRASYVEIYNEKVNDLLKPTNADLRVREEDGQFVIKDVTEEVANSSIKVIQLMLRGEKNRRIAETNMNERSSRSHTIFRLIVESREARGGDESDGAIQVSHLNLVDLAGSEKTGQMNATADRFKEGCSINLSLTTLGKVIRDLSEGENYINYRGSNLTRILQSSLGGNALTAIVCTVTPAAVDQTTNTIKFAQRAKTIKNQPKVNEVLSDAALIKRYSRQLSKLQGDLAKSKSKETQLEAMSSQLREKDMIVERLQQRIDMIQEKLINSSNTEDYALTERARAKRRQTWCASGPSAKRMSMFPARSQFPVSLHTVVEEDSQGSVRTSLDSTSSQSDFETPLEDFEQQLLEYEQAGLNDFPEFSPTSCGFSTPLAHSSFVTVRRGASCDVAPLRTQVTALVDEARQASALTTLLTGCDVAPLRTHVTALVDEARQASALTTPPATLRQRAVYYERQMAELVEFTRLEKETLDREQDHKIEVAKLGKEIKALEKKVTALESSRTDLEYEMEVAAGKHRRREEELKASLDEARAKLETSAFAPSLSETSPSPVETGDLDSLRFESDDRVRKLNAEIENLKRDNETLTRQLEVERNRVAKLGQLMENSFVDGSSFEQSLQDILDVSVGISNETSRFDGGRLRDPLAITAFLDGSSVTEASTIVFAANRESRVDESSRKCDVTIEEREAMMSHLSESEKTLEKGRESRNEDELEIRVKDLTDKLETMSAELNGLSSERERMFLQSASSELELESLREKCANQASQVDELSGKLAKTNEEHEALVSRLEESEKELEKLKEVSHAELKTEMNHLTDKLQAVSAELDQMSSLYTISEQEVESLREKYAKEASQVDKLSGKLAKTNEERETMTSRLEEYERELEKLRESNNAGELQTEVKDLTEKLEIVSAELDKLSSEREQISSLCASSAQELDLLREKCANQDTQVEELSVKLANTNEEREAMTSRLEESERELEKLREGNNKDEELQTKVNDLTNKLGAMSAELEQISTEREQMSSRCASSEQELDLLREKCANQDTQVEELSVKLANTNEEREAMTLRLEESERELEKLREGNNEDEELQTKVNDLTNKLGALSAELEQISTEREQMSSRCASSEQELDLLREKCANQDTQVEELSVKLANTNKEREAMTLRLEESKRELEKLREGNNEDEELQTKVNDLTNKLGALSAELEQISTEREQMSSRCASSEQELDLLREKCANQDTQVEELSVKLANTNKEREAMTLRLEESERELEKLREGNNKDESRLQTKVNDLTNKLGAISAELEQISTEREQMSSRCASSEQELDLLREKCANQDTQVEELSAKLANTNEECEAMTLRLEEYERELEKLRESNNEDEELQTKVNDLTNKLEAMSAELEQISTEREQMSSLCESSEQELDLLREKCANQDTQVEELSVKLANTNEEREVMTLRLEEYERELEKLRESNNEDEELQTKVNDLTNKLGAMSAEREQMSSRCATSEQELDLLREKCANQDTQVDELSVKLANTNEEREAMTLRLEEYVRELEKLREGNNEDKELQTKVNDLTNKLGAMSAELEQISTEREQMSSRCASSEQELDLLREKCANQDTQVEELSVKLANTKEEREAMTLRLEDYERQLEKLREGNNEDEELQTKVNDLTNKLGAMSAEREQISTEREQMSSLFASSEQELDLLREKCANQDTQVEQLSVKLANTNEERAAMTSRLEAYERELEKFRESSNEDELRTQVKDLTEKLEIVSAELNQVSSLCTISEQELDLLREKCTNQVSQVVELSGKLAKTNEEHEAMTSRLKDSEKELEKLREGSNEEGLHTEVKDLSEKLERMSSLRASSQQELESLRVKLIDQASQIDELSAKLSFATSELTKTIGERDAFISQLEESKKEVASLAESIKQDIVVVSPTKLTKAVLEQETSFAKRQITDAKWEKLSEENVEKDRQLEIISEKLSVASLELIKTCARQNELESQLEIASNELKRCAEENGKYVLEIEDLSGKLSTQLAKSIEEREAIMSQLQNSEKDVARFKEESINQESVINGLLEKLSTTSSELAKSRDDCKEMKSRLQKNIDELQLEKEQLLSRLESSSKRKSTGEKSDTNMTSLLEELSSYKEKLVKEIHCLDPTSNKSNVSRMQLNELVNLLLKKVVEKQMEIKREYNSEMDSLRGRLKQSNSWTEVVEKENEKLQSDLSDAIERNSKLALELKSAGEELATSVGVKTSLRESLTAREAELGRALSELSDIKAGLKAGDKVDFGKQRIADLEAILGEEVARYEKVALRCDINEKQTQRLLQESRRLELDLQESERKRLAETKSRLDLEAKLSEVRSTIDAQRRTLVESFVGKFATVLGRDVGKDVVDVDSLVDNVTFALLDARNQLSGSQQSFAELERKSASTMKVLTEEKSLLESRLKTAEKLVGDANNEIVSLRTELEGTISKCGHLEITNANSEIEKAKIYEVIRELEGKLSSSESNGRSYLERVEDLQSKLACNEKQLQDTVKQLAELEETLRTVQNATSVSTHDLQSKLACYEKQLQDTVKQLAESEERLRTVQNATGASTHTSDELASLQKELEVSHADNVALDDENKALKRQSAKANATVETLRQELNVVTAKYEVILTAKNAADLQGHIDRLREKLEEAEERNKFLDDESNELFKMNTDLEKDREKDYLTIKELRKQLAESQKGGKSLADVSATSSELSEARMRIGALERDLSSREREHKQEAIQLRYKLRETDSKLSRAEATSRQLSSELKEKCREVALKDTEVALKDAEVASMARNLREVTTSRDELLRRDRTPCECAALAETLRTTRDELNSKKGQVARLQLQIEVEEMPYRKKCEELEAAAILLRQRNNELKTSLRKAQSELLNCTKVEDCAACIRRSRTHDREAQTEPTPLSMTSAGSGIVREHSFAEMQRQCHILREKNETYKRVARDRLAYITQLENEKENANPNFKRRYQVS